MAWGFFTLGGIGSGIGGGSSAPCPRRNHPDLVGGVLILRRLALGVVTTTLLRPIWIGRFACEIIARVRAVSTGIGRGGCLGYLV